MDLWDTAGQEKFRSLLTLYYKNSDAVIIVFDVNDPNTFKTVDYWARQIETHCDAPPGIPCPTQLQFSWPTRSTFASPAVGSPLMRSGDTWQSEASGGFLSVLPSRTTT
jgi:hypothetical protein